MFRIRLIITFCCCFHFLLVESQTPYAISLNRSAGLSSNVTYDVIQDSRGFIWIASNDGLVRYDGFEFKNYINSNQSSLAGSSLMEDKFGRIWYQNFDGNLSYVENDQLHNLSNSSTVDYFKQGIVGDKLYVRHQKGFEVFDLKNLKKIKFIPFSWKLKFYNQGFCSDGLYYFIDSNELYFFDENDEIQFKCFLPDIATIWEVVIYKGAVFFLSRNDNTCIYKFENNKLQKFASFECLDQVLGLKIFKNECWVLTSNGAYSFSMDGKLIQNQIFEGKKITNLTKDRQGNYWFTSLMDGVYLVPDLHQKIIHLSDNLPFKINRTNEGFLIGTKNHHVLKTDEELQQRQILFSGNTNADVYFIYEDTSQNTIFFSSNGFDVYNPKKNIFKHHFSALKDVCKIDDSYYAIACSGMLGLYRNPLAKSIENSPWNVYDNGESEIINIKPELNYMRARSVVYDSIQKHLLYATNKGVFLITPKKTHEIKNHGKSVHLLKLIIHNDLVLALSTSGELFHMDSNFKFHSLNSLFKLNKYEIKQLKKSNNLICIRTSNSLFITDGFSKKSVIEQINVNLSSFDVYDVSVANKHIFITTDQGIMRVKRINKSFEKFLPPFFINSLIINDNQVDIKQVNHLKSYQNNIVIHFSLLSYGKVWKNQLFYRVNKSQWISISKDERFLKFASLSPGKYSVEFMWQGDKNHIYPSKIHFKISEPFYKQYWFIVSSFVFLVIAIFLYFRQQLHVIQRKNQLITDKMELENKLSKSILTSIKSQMNPHFFYNALNTIQSYIFMNDKKNASSYLSKFSKLTRMILEMSEKETITIQDEIKALTLYLELEKMRFEENFEFKIVVDPNLDLDYHKIPSMLIQPYVENAIKHGLLHKVGHKKLNITLSKENQYLKISIEDNGIGRFKAEELNKIRENKHQSFSTQANERRIEILNQQSSSNVNVEIIDLYNNGLAVGTKVIINLLIN